MGNVETKKVFISYSWTSEEHKEKVNQLADALISYGVEVVVDIYDLKPGQDKYEFMEKIVNDPSVDKVLIISDKVYSEKANRREGGVGTETQIITPSLYENLGENRFIPVVFEKNEDTGEAFLPIYAQSRIYIDLSNDQVYQEGLEQLIRYIYEKPERRKPKLGKAPAYIFDEKLNTFVIESKANEVEHAFSKGPKRVSFSLKDYFEAFIEELDKLKVKEKPEEDLDAASFRMIDESLPFRQSFVKVMHVFVQEENVDPNFIVEFFEDFYNKIYQMEEEDGLAPEAAKFLLAELFICSTAIFIKYKRWDILVNTLNYLYFNKKYRRYCSFGSLRIPAIYIYKGQIQKNSGRNSLIADKMEKRSSDKEFNLMIEADMFLYYVSKINPSKGVDYPVEWFPETYIFLERINKNIKVLISLKSKSHLKKLLPIFGVSEEKLLEIVPLIEGKRGFSRSWQHIPGFEEILKADMIGTQL